MRYKTRVWQPFRKRSYRDAWQSKYLPGVIQELGRDLRRCHERIWWGYCDYDIFSIDHWFLGLVPTMLEDFKDHLHGCPEVPDSISQRVLLTEDEKDDPAMEAWKAVLDRMIFLLKEADEETCSRENPYQEQYDRAQIEFEEKYGPWGEKLMTSQEKEDEKRGKGRRIYLLDSLEEYRQIAEKYSEQSRLIEQYRRDCKNEALALFSKWFYYLLPEDITVSHQDIVLT